LNSPPHTPEAIARGVFAAIAAHDLAAIAGYLAQDDVQEFVPVGLFEGRDAVLGFFADLLKAFPDLEMTVQDLHADGSSVAVSWTIRGTFTGGRFVGIEPTGARVEMRGVDAFIEVEDGLIRRNTIFYDGAAFARSVGLLPARGSAGERVLLALFNLWTRARRRLHPGLRRRVSED
jgi:steroid delta-isomerase-like uncharacterized protein